MSNENIQSLVSKLKDEISTTDKLDQDTRQMLESFDIDLQRVVDDNVENQVSLVDTALELETRFAAEHPVAEGMMREVINALAKMGI